ncbi:hypothetical protein ON010_g8772 [Phytophthora cinnamomi]|nr:hypothetical protein ON010_g8772 [Phytophthora cinnamomi]
MEISTVPVAPPASPRTSSVVKSFANAALKFDHVPISSVTSIPSTIEYDFKYEGKVVANVTYDLFTTSTLGGDAEYEVMVWLAAIGGAGPLSNTGSAVAQVTVGGVDFNLCRGKNGNMTVYSYVATNTPTSFSADFKQCGGFRTRTPTGGAGTP